MMARILPPAFRRLVLLAVLLTLPGIAAAQTAPAPAPAAPAPTAPAITQEQIDRLIGTLQNEAERAHLIEQLHLLAAAQRQTEPEPPPPLHTVGARLLAQSAERLGALGDQLGALGETFRDVPRLARWVRDQAASPTGRQRWIDTGIVLAAVLAAAVAALLLVRCWLLAGPRRALEQRREASLPVRLGLVVARALLDLVPLLGFMLAAYGVIGVLEPRFTVRVLVIGLINASLLIGLVLLVMRAVLAPRVPGLRLVPLGDVVATGLYHWVRRIAYLAVLGYAVVETATALGLPSAARDGLLNLVGLAVALMLVVFVLRSRRTVAGLIRGTAASNGGTGAETGAVLNAAPGSSDPGAAGQDASALRRGLAEIWHVLSIIAIVVLYGIWILSIDNGFIAVVRASLLTVAVVLAAGLLSSLARRALQRGAAAALPPPPGAGPGTAGRVRLIVPVLERGVAIAIVALAGLSVLEVWGLGGLEWLGSALGRRIVASILAIGFVLLASWIAWEIASRLIERQLSRTGGDGEPGEQSARMRTLLPLLRNALLVLLLTVATLIVLSEVGINIAPLLAGAGVVGLAIGFGAQTLVKDVITGLFMLFENTIAIGDVVNIGSHGGLVEGLTIRTIRLRDLAGNVHTIPFSEVKSVMNMTRDFSYYVFDIGVSYGADLDQVMEVVKELGAELQEDPVYAEAILEPIEILGVDAFAESAVVVKARFKTKPIKQWMVGREFNRRLKKRFDELGIEIPFRHVAVVFGEDQRRGAAAGSAPLIASPAALAALAGAMPGAGSRAESRVVTPDVPGGEPAESTVGHDRT